MITNHEHVETVAKAAVPAGTGMMLFGVPLEPIAIVLGIIYTIAMTLHLLWKWHKEYHEYRRKTP